MRLAAFPGLFAVGVFLFWAAVDGGFSPLASAPGGLLLAGLLVTVILAGRGAVRRPGRLELAAIACLAAFAAWAYLSILWADVEADAWTGANRCLVYAIVFAVFALLPWRPRTSAAVLGLYAAGLAVVGVVVLQRGASGEGSSVLAEGRFFEPVGYANANAALFLGGSCLALVLASRGWVQAFGRAVMLAVSGTLVELGLMSQSRASLFALPVAAVVLLAVVPGRVRSLVHAVPVAVAALAARGPLLDLYGTVETGGAREALADARTAVLLSAASLFAVGLLVALAEPRLPLSQAGLAAARRAVGAAAVAGAVLAAAVLFAVAGNPATRVADAWREFTGGQTEEAGSSHFASGLGSNRYDFWRVGVEVFAAAPLTGAGADNFAVDYLRERRSPEEPLYPHSLEVMALAETGLVGTVLLAGFFACAVAAALRARRGAGPLLQGVSGAALVAFAYWAAHGSVDWFWEFPGLTAPALAWLGLAGALREASPAADEVPPSSGAARRVGLAAGGVVLVAAAVFSLGLPWLSERDVELAKRDWRSRPAEAFARLEDARALNPWSDRPDVVAGVIAVELDERGRAGEAFRGALARNPHNWFAHVELAVLAARDGRRGEALEHLRAADALNPREPVVDLVLGQVQRREPVSAEEIHRLLEDRLKARST